MNYLYLEDLIQKVNQLDYHNSFIKELNLKWNTSYEDGFLYDYESPPSLFIKFCIPETNNYMVLQAEEVINYSPRLLDEFEIFIETYASYYRLYINSKEEYPNSFIEFKKINTLEILDISQSD